MMALASDRVSPRTIVALAWRELLTAKAEQRPRVLALALLAVYVAALGITTIRWFDAGVDGVLSWRPVSAGFEVRQLRPGADTGGLHVGDVIVARDGTPATERASFWDKRRHGHAGQEVVLTVRPAGATTLEDRRFRLTPTLATPDQLALFVVLLLVLLLIPAAAGLVFLVRPHDLPARLFFAAAMTHCIATMLFFWDKAVGQTVDPVWHWYAYIPPRYLASALYTHLMFVFPVAHPWFVRPRRLGWRSARWLLALFVVYAVPTGLVTWLIADSFPDPLDFGALVSPIADRTARIQDLAILPTVLTLFALGYQFTRAKDKGARAPLWWLAGAVALRGVVAVWTGPTILPFVGQVQPLSSLFIHISNVIVFSAIAVALVRYRVVAVTPWVRRAVVYPLAIAVIVGAYDLFAGAIGRALAAFLGSDIASNPAFAALPVLIVVALLRPVRTRLQRMLDSTLDRSLREVEAFVVEASAALTKPDVMIDRLLTTVAAERLRLVGAWLVSADETAPPAVPQGALGVTVPLVVPIAGAADRRVGTWILGRRVNAEPFDETQTRLLARLAQDAALRLDHQRLLAKVGG